MDFDAFTLEILEIGNRFVHVIVVNFEREEPEAGLLQRRFFVIGIGRRIRIDRKQLEDRAIFPGLRGVE